MRAHGDAVLSREAHRAAHHGRVSRMRPARDIRRRNRPHHRLVVAHAPGAERFAHVAVEIYVPTHRSTPGFLPIRAADVAGRCSSQKRYTERRSIGATEAGR